MYIFLLLFLLLEVLMNLILSYLIFVNLLLVLGKLGNLIVGQNMRDNWLNLEVGYNKHFLVEYCSRDVPDHESTC